MINKKLLVLVHNIALWIDLYLLRNADAYKQIARNGGFILDKDITLKELYKFYSKF